MNISNRFFIKISNNEYIPLVVIDGADTILFSENTGIFFDKVVYTVSDLYSLALENKETYTYMGKEYACEKIVFFIKNAIESAKPIEEISKGYRFKLQGMRYPGGDFGVQTIETSKKLNEFLKEGKWCFRCPRGKERTKTPVAFEDSYIIIDGFSSCFHRFRKGIVYLTSIDSRNYIRLFRSEKSAEKFIENNNQKLKAMKQVFIARPYGVMTGKSADLSFYFEKEDGTHTTRLEEAKKYYGKDLKTLCGTDYYLPENVKIFAEALKSFDLT